MSEKDKLGRKSVINVNKEGRVGERLKKKRNDEKE